MSVPFQTIERGHYSAIEDALAETYRTRRDFEAFWGRHGSNSVPPPDVPDVDFASQMVAVVFMGTQNSGGYSVEITSVDDEGDGKLVVNYMTTVPPPGAMVTMALTQPYHIVRLDASDKNVVFVGSAKPPPPPAFPTFVLTFSEGADKNAIVSQIEAFPAVKNVRMMVNLGIAMVDFDSENISTDEAMKLLEGVVGVKSVEADSPMGI
eukprot:CAMPEP_0197456982 /NCGR_PEP_ID=MMETSP1175-20131217/44847_1 /TAXON_ID=1003142 /ORGANISM="Triceratium dubium, Strain CCMP147" /LENGTH=207 /DNA_ID=CAMNT_0042991225 /DNA_START=41 /DNA_END=664 /DNA_ORIENTATION=-